MNGHWTCDDLASLARVLARNIGTLDAMEAGPARVARRAGERITAIARRNTRSGSRRNIAEHYDLSNDFFRLFLDESMMYSSAFFDRDDASLEEAQLAKLDRLCKKLDLQPGDHLLEIGTGWGGLADPRGACLRVPRHDDDHLARSSTDSLPSACAPRVSRTASRSSSATTATSRASTTSSSPSR